MEDLWPPRPSAPSLPQMGIAKVAVDPRVEGNQLLANLDIRVRTSGSSKLDGLGVIAPQTRSQVGLQPASRPSDSPAQSPDPLRRRPGARPRRLYGLGGAQWDTDAMKVRSLKRRKGQLARAQRVARGVKVGAPKKTMRIGVARGN